MARRRRNTDPNIMPRYLRDNQFAAYMSCGRNKAREIADAAGAVVRIGSARFTDVVRVDEYLQKQMQSGQDEVNA